MMKALVFVSAILVFTYSACEGLVCYHCFSPSKSGLYAPFPPCNERNMTASNTMTCESPESQCIYEVLETGITKQVQIFRTCSDPKHPPCGKEAVPPGYNRIECWFCGTDKCNLYPNATEKTFTFNINANVSLTIL